MQVRNYILHFNENIFTFVYPTLNAVLADTCSTFY